MVGVNLDAAELERELSDVVGLEHGADGSGRNFCGIENFEVGETGRGERLFASCVGDAWRNQVCRFVVGECDNAKEVAAEQYGRRFRNELGNVSERQVRFAACCGVVSVASFEFVVVVVLRLFAFVAGFAFFVADLIPFGDGAACLIDHHGAHVIRVLGEFAEQHQAFAAIRAGTDVQDFRAARNFADGVAGRNFGHAAFVVL